MLIGQLRALAEGATYYGSTGDPFPHKNLDEVLYESQMVCLGAQLDLIDYSAKQNETLVESVLNYSSDDQISAIVEAGVDGFINKIKGILEKIKKFLKSVLDKIVLAFRKMTMSGHQLWEKYKNSPALTSLSNSLDIETKGYVFKDLNPLLTNITKYKSELDMRTLQKTALGQDLGTKFDQYVGTALDNPNKIIVASGTNDKDFREGENTAKSEVDELLQEIKDIDTAERDSRIASALVNSDVGDKTIGDWIWEEYVGDEQTIKYGSDGFTKDAIGNILGKDLASQEKAIKDQFNAVISTADSIKGKMERSIKDLRSGSDKSNAVKDTDTKETKETKAIDAAKVTAVCGLADEYVNLFGKITTVITNANNACIKIIQKKNEQAKRMLGMLLSYKKKKSEDAGDIDMFDIVTLEYDL